MKHVPLVAAYLAVAVAVPALAQAPAERVALGVRAYQDLDYDQAATQLRAALAVPGGLADSVRVRALVFLGATELFRERRDSAVAAFRHALLLDVRARPDALVFPPEVQGLFQEVRLSTRAVAAAPPATTVLSTAGDRVVIRLHATTYHEIAVTVVPQGSAAARQLYAGAIGDSLDVLWDGRDAAGAASPPAPWTLRVVSRGGDGRPARTLELPLEVRHLARDTLPWPAPLPDSVLRPETAPGRGGLSRLLIGLGAAAAVIVLPSAVGAEGDAMAARYAVAGALGAAGVMGLAHQRRPQPLPDNIAANAARRDAWRRELDAVRSRNAATMATPRLQVSGTGPARASSP